MSEAPPTQLRNLQVLRALAAVSVVLQHAVHDSGSLAGAPAPAGPQTYAGNLGFGVDVFFVISGFIMAHTMAADFGRSGAPRTFLLRRLARIVPLYWLLTTVLVLGSLVVPSFLNVPIGDLWHVIASYLFIPDARVTGEIRPVLALGWTLQFEMFFYALFAVALTAPLRRGLARLSLVMVSLAILHGLLAHVPTPFVFWTNPIILEFLFGIGIAMALRAGVRLPLTAALVLGAAGLSGFLLYLPYPDESAFMARFIVVGVPATLLVGAAALGPSTGRGPVVAFGIALGDASYSLYLAHPFVVRPLRVMWARFIGAGLPPFVYVAVCCLVSIAVAFAVHRLLERPLTRALQRRLGPPGRRRPRSAEPLVASQVQS